jgi:hypothetical protein
MISKLEKQQTKERKQNTKIYQTWKNNDVFPLTQATLINQTHGMQTQIRKKQNEKEDAKRSFQC